MPTPKASDAKRCGTGFILAPTPITSDPAYRYIATPIVRDHSPPRPTPGRTGTTHPQGQRREALRDRIYPGPDPHYLKPGVTIHSHPYRSRPRPSRGNAGKNSSHLWLIPWGHILHASYKTPVANRQHTAVCKKQDLTPCSPLSLFEPLVRRDVGCDNVVWFSGLAVAKRRRIKWQARGRWCW